MGYRKGYTCRVYGWISPLFLSKDGKKLIINNVSKILDLETLTIIDSIKLSVDICYGFWDDCVAWSWDGKYLGMMGRRSGVYIYDIERKEIVYKLPEKIYGGYSIDFSRDGKYIAYGYSVYCLDFERIKRKIEAVGVPEEPAKNEFFVYYNPLKVDYITIDSPMEEIVPTTITIYNMYGNKVREVECGAILYKYGKYDIPSGQLPSGVYFVVINSGGKVVAQKFMVVH